MKERIDELARSIEVISVYSKTESVWSSASESVADQKTGNSPVISPRPSSSRLNVSFEAFSTRYKTVMEREGEVSDCPPPTPDVAMDRYR